ncbi:hypothetical protein ACFX2A_022120 [Malus domestica]
MEGPWVWHGETFGDPLPSSQATQQIAGVNTPHYELGPLLEDIFSGPSGMAGMPINNHTSQEVQYLHMHVSFKPWCKTPTWNYIRVVV